MNRSKTILLYQDEPASGTAVKLIMGIVPAALLGVSIYLWSKGESTGGRILLVEAVVVGMILWAVLPRRYEVYEDHLRIVLGGPFAFKVGFDQIKIIEVTNRTGRTINFVTTITRTYVMIVRKKGLSIAITPKSNDLFVENALRASSQWEKTKLSY